MPSNRKQRPLRDVAPAEPIAGIIGGKRLLARHIAKRIEAVRHRCYAEPFVGMGGVFLRRARRPLVEAINDVNGDIANLFRIVASTRTSSPVNSSGSSPRDTNSGGCSTSCPRPLPTSSARLASPICRGSGSAAW